MSTNEDLVNKFIKQAKTETKVTPPVSSRNERILVGILISVITAAVYSVIAETINFFHAPDLPLYFHPFGTAGNILYAILLGGLVGITSTWSEKATAGMMVGGFIMFIGVQIRQFLSSAFFISLLIPTSFSFFALFTIAYEIVLLTLLVGLIRLAVDVNLEKPNLKFWHWQKILPILTLLGIAIFAGYLHKIPKEWVYSIRTANNLVQEGLKAKTLSELPEQLSEGHMGNFLEYANDDYKLEVNNSIQHLFDQADPYLRISFHDNIVIVYFESGQDIACLVNGGESLKCLPIIRRIKFSPIIL